MGCENKYILRIYFVYTYSVLKRGIQGWGWSYRLDIEQFDAIPIWKKQLIDTISMFDTWYISILISPRMVSAWNYKRFKKKARGCQRMEGKTPSIYTMYRKSDISILRMYIDTHRYDTHRYDNNRYDISKVSQSTWRKESRRNKAGVWLSLPNSLAIGDNTAGLTRRRSSWPRCFFEFVCKLGGRRTPPPQHHPSWSSPFFHYCAM